MLVRTFFSFSYDSDIKSLPGFVKGGRDKVPKELSDYQSGLISRWAEKAIKEHIEAVATKAKNNLDISARNFKSPSYHTGTGGFECQYFKYDFSVTQSEEDFSQCIFTGVLEVDHIDRFNEVKDVIDSCFEFTFENISYSLPEGKKDLKELIYTLDDNKKILSATFDFSYENDFSSFELIHKEKGRTISVNNKEVDISFNSSESIPDMILALQEANENIFQVGSKEQQLLTDG